MPAGNLSTWRNPGNSWFLGIGINSYKEFPNLTNAVRDVLVIKDLMTTLYDVDHEYVHLILDENATEEKIMDTLDYLSRSVQQNDKLIIYYSGHGRINKELNRGYWLPHDAKQDSTARYLLNSTIQDYVGGIDAKHVLLISDACFSGSMFMRGDHRSAALADELEERSSRWAICSGRHDEEVYDGDPGGHSPFAQSLINVLSNTKKEFIPVGSVINYVIEETAANYEQLPDGRPMFGVGHQGGQYVFRKKDAQKKAVHHVEEKKPKIITKRQPTKTESQQLSDEAGLKMVKWVGLSVLGAFVVVGGIIIGTLMLGNKDTTIDSFKTITYGNNTWMTSNLSKTLPDDQSWINKHPMAKEKNLGRLYTYQGAVRTCQSLADGTWHLPSLDDMELLHQELGFGEIEFVENKSQTLNSNFVKQLMLGESSGLNLTLGGNYLINSNEFIPDNNAPVDEGVFWLKNNHKLHIQRVNTEYIADIGPYPTIWNHAYSCRCIKNKN